MPSWLTVRLLIQRAISGRQVWKIGHGKGAGFPDMDAPGNKVRNRTANSVGLNHFYAFNFADQDEFVARLDSCRIDLAREEEDKEADWPDFFIRRGRTIFKRQLVCRDKAALVRVAHGNYSATHLGHMSFEIRVDF